VAGDKERQRRLARERHLQHQARRRAMRERRRKQGLIALSIVAACGLIVGLVFAFLPSSPAKPTAAAHASSSAKASASASPTASASTAASVKEPATHCTYTPATPVARKVSFPPSTPDYTASYTATLHTNLGNISLDLLNSKATCTVNSFVHLAEAGYFNQTQCHRLVTTSIYVLQCGDPYATSTTKLTCGSTVVGTGTPGYKFASENLTGATYTAGTVAMANEGTATSNGSQFFIVYKNIPTGDLAPSYTPFATVSSGLNIVQNVAKAGNACQVTSDGQSEGGPPKEKVIIDSVTIQKT
jgi:peptidyl-prolyl cis-trans isomerase B (cyclophilin B)